MGQALNYEIGRLNLNRRVKVWSRQVDGKQHGMGARLVAAHEKYAECIIDNHGPKPERIEWSGVRDWPSHNEHPLIMPAAPAKPAVAAKLQPTVVPAPAVPHLTATSDPFAVFGTLSSRLPEAVAEIDAAEEEIDAATEMLQQAKVRHNEAVGRLADLRKQLATATAVIDRHLTGTSAAPSPVSAK